MPADPLQSLSDRVEKRVAEARVSLDRRSRASRPKSQRRGRSAPDSPSSPQGRAAAHETRSLRQVFHELGDSHRQYRARTGQPVSIPLREAALAFKREPSLISLVAVAVHLDEIGILAW